MVDRDRFAADDRGDAGEGDVFEDFFAGGDVEVLNHPASGELLIGDEIFGRVDGPRRNAHFLQSLDDVLD